MKQFKKREHFILVILFVVTSIAFGVRPVNAEDTLESIFVESGGWKWSGDNKGGLVIAVSSCGCPKPASKRPRHNEQESWYWPTRCLYENRGTRHVDDNRVPYPQHEYPEGYPSNNIFPPSGSAGVIPFPGWPAAKPKKKNKASKWGSTLRSNYKKNYCKQKDAYIPSITGAKKHCRAGSVRQTHADIRAEWKHYWQIHHILEQKHNGRDNCANMVPALSKGGTNKHSEYTNFWQAIRVDSEFFPTHATKDTTWTVAEMSKIKETWEAIKDCKIEVWTDPGNNKTECFEVGR